MRRPFAPAAAMVFPIAALLLTACVDTTDQQGSGYPYGGQVPTYGPSSGGVYAPGYGTPYGYQHPHQNQNRDHSRYFYPENNVRCDRATSVCEKWRGREQGFQADPSETKDYFGKGARRELLREQEGSPPPPAVRSAPLPGPRPPAAPPPPVMKAPVVKVPPTPALSPQRPVPPPAVERKAPPLTEPRPRRSGEEWLKQQSTQ